MNRFVLGLMFACVGASVGYAEDSPSSLKVGDRIELQLTGRPAADFIRLVGRPLPTTTFDDTKQTGLTVKLACYQHRRRQPDCGVLPQPREQKRRANDPDHHRGPPFEGRSIPDNDTQFRSGRTPRGTK